MFRASVQKQYAEIDETGEKANEDKTDTKPAAKSQREIMAAAAEKRFVTDASSPEPKRAKIDFDSDKAAKTNDDTQQKVNGNGSDEDDDVALALEMIETALHNLLAKVAATPQSQHDESTISNEQKDWASNQLPRFLICLGDVYPFREEHGKAVDAYVRALSYREDKWKEIKEKNEPCSIEHLQRHRLYIEACTLVAEAFLASPDGEDVVCDGDDERMTLAKAGERIDFANSWYAMAREELEDHCKWLVYCVHLFNSILLFYQLPILYVIPEYVIWPKCQLQRLTWEQRRRMFAF